MRRVISAAMESPLPEPPRCQAPKRKKKAHKAVARKKGMRPILLRLSLVFSLVAMDG